MSPWARLALFVAVLMLVFGASFAVGSTGDPIARPLPTEVDHDAHG